MVLCMIRVLDFALYLNSTLTENTGVHLVLDLALYLNSTLTENTGVYLVLENSIFFLKGMKLKLQH